MKKFGHYLLCILRWCWRNWKTTMILLVLLVIAFIGWRMYRIISSGGTLVELSHTENIENTPEEVRAIKDVGQWEFLSVSTEELVEKHESHTFGDKHLVKVFKGTLRIGVDMQKAGDDWFSADDKIATLHLPDVGLLDENFIDEARTVTFYEKGTFSTSEQQALYDEAAKAMKARALTPANLNEARAAAKSQFTNLFKSLGYDEVVIYFPGQKPTADKS